MYTIFFHWLKDCSRSDKQTVNDVLRFKKTFNFCLVLLIYLQTQNLNTDSTPTQKDAIYSQRHFLNCNSAVYVSGICKKNKLLLWLYQFISGFSGKD